MFNPPLFRLISAYLDYIIANICCHFKNRKVYLQVDFTTLSCVQKKASARKLPAEAFSITIYYAAPAFFFAFSSFSNRSFSSYSSRHFWNFAISSSLSKNSVMIGSYIRTIFKISCSGLGNGNGIRPPYGQGPNAPYVIYIVEKNRFP